MQVRLYLKLAIATALGAIALAIAPVRPASAALASPNSCPSRECVGARTFLGCCYQVTAFADDSQGVCWYYNEVKCPY